VGYPNSQSVQGKLKRISKTSFVSGHDFSRADKVSKMSGALAPEGTPGAGEPTSDQPEIHGSSDAGFSADPARHKAHASE
jgi:hypothetical protein